jgi:hypothetical protein
MYFYFCDDICQSNRWASSLVRVLAEDRCCLEIERAVEFSNEESITKSVGKAGCRWLTPIIPATQEAEIRRIMI